MKYIDLSHVFDNGMPVYPGDPTPEIIQTAELSEAGYNDYQVKTGMHVGTHIDAPLHMIDGGKRISEIELDKFSGRGHLIDAQELSRIGPELLEGRIIKKGDVVLIMTGFYEKYRHPDYYKKYPEMTEAFAQRLVELGAGIVGSDTPSPDRPPFNVHKILLGNGVLIIENLTNLKALAGVKNFSVSAFPPRYRTEAAPVRVVAMVD